MAFTRAQLVTQFQRVMRWYSRLLEWGQTISGNVVVTQSGIYASVNGGNHAATVTNAFDAQRAAMASAAASTQLFDAHLLEWADFLDLPRTSPAGIIDAMYRWAIDNSELLAPRGLNFQAPQANGGNTGNGVIRRLTVDDRNYNLGPAVADSFEARCLVDANTEGGARNREQFLVESDIAARDALQLTGLGVARTLVCADPFVDSMLANASFESRGGNNADPTSLTDWEVSAGVSAGVMTLVSGNTNTYLPAAAETEIRRSVRLVASTRLTQRLDRRGTLLDQYRPIYAAIAYRASGGGTLALRLGQISASVAYTAATWAVLELSTSTTAWYRSIVKEALAYEIQNTRTSGAVRIDDAWLVYWTPIAGTYYLARPGRVPFRAGTLPNAAGDKFTWADSGGTTGINLRTFQRLTGRSFPYAASAGAATISD